MPITHEENEYLTRVGPGTPAGELLRRYWFPVAVAGELTEDNPTRFVRLLGEDLVLFKDKSGRVGLLGDHCPHRGASLLYGRVEERGIACAYHGWLYDVHGQCLETPAEPVESNLHLTVRHRAYPVREMAGLFWAYLGPLPAPAIPKYDIWARSDGVLKLAVYPQLDANWLQVMENTADPVHAQVLHQEYVNRGGIAVTNTTRGLLDRVVEIDFYEAPFGLVKIRKFANGLVERHPLIFPNILRESNVAQIRVPTDDTHTNFFFIHFIPGDGNGSSAGAQEDEVLFIPPYKSAGPTARRGPGGSASPPAPGPAWVTTIHPFARFNLDCVMAQDFMVWETPGPIADRTAEHLASSDRGVIMLRDILQREIEKVQRGLDPLGVIRDPDHPIIDTFMKEAIAERWYQPRQYAWQDQAPSVRAVNRYE